MASATGWDVDYIMNGINYQTLIMMLADAPRYVNSRKSGTGEASAEEEASGIVGFYQSQLK